MELKLNYFFVDGYDPALLIVPYGIETHSYYFAMHMISYLLIVPYGIETD